MVNLQALQAIHEEKKYELSPLFLRIWHFSPPLQKTLNFIPLRQNPLIKTGINVVCKTEIFLQLKAENPKNQYYIYNLFMIAT